MLDHGILQQNEPNFKENLIRFYLAPAKGTKFPEKLCPSTSVSFYSVTRLFLGCFFQPKNKNKNKTHSYKTKAKHSTLPRPLSCLSFWARCGKRCFMVQAVALTLPFTKELPGVWVLMDCRCGHSGPIPPGTCSALTTT